MLVELKSGIHRQWKHFNRDLKILLKAACVSQSVVFFGGPPGANDLKGIDGQLHVTYHIYIYTKRDIYIYSDVHITQALLPAFIWFWIVALGLPSGSFLPKDSLDSTSYPESDHDDVQMLR